MLPKFEEIHKYKHANIFTNFMLNKQKEIHTKIHYNQFIKSQRLRNSFKGSKRK